MQSLISSNIFRYWIVQIAFGCLVIWLGLFLQRANDEELAARLELAKGPPPPVTQIADFELKLEGRRFAEARVLAQIDVEATTLLVQKSKGMTTSEKLMYVLLDTDATPETRTARAVVVIDADEEDAFKTWVLARLMGAGMRGPILQIEGLAKAGSGDTQVTDALKDRGFDGGHVDFNITPFLEGREAALTSLPSDHIWIVLGIFAFGGLFLVLGLVRMVLWGRRLMRPKAPPQNAVPAHAEKGLANAGLGGPNSDAAVAAKKAPQKLGLIGSLMVGLTVISLKTGHAEWLVPVQILFTLYLVRLWLFRGLRALAFFGPDKLTGLHRSRALPSASFAPGRHATAPQAAPHDLAQPLAGRGAQGGFMQAADQAPPLTLENGALIESRGRGWTPYLPTLLRWGPFALALAIVSGLVAFDGRFAGMQPLGKSPVSSLILGEPAVKQIGPGAVQKVGQTVEPPPATDAPLSRIAQPEPGPVAAPQTASRTDTDRPSAEALLLPGLGRLVPTGGLSAPYVTFFLLLVMAIAASVLRGWFTRRRALPAANDPWARLEERLRLPQKG